MSQYDCSHQSITAGRELSKLDDVVWKAEVACMAVRECCKRKVPGTRLENVKKNEEKRKRNAPVNKLQFDSKRGGARTHPVSVSALSIVIKRLGKVHDSGIAQSGGLCFWPSRCPVNPLSNVLESWGRSVSVCGECDCCFPAVQGDLGWNDRCSRRLRQHRLGRTIMTFGPAAALLILHAETWKDRSPSPLPNTTTRGTT